MSRNKVLEGGRILWIVPTYAEQQRAKALKVELDRVVPASSLDHCHVRGRGLALAESKIRPAWKYMDVANAFPSIYLPRLWTELRRLGGRKLELRTRRFFADLNNDEVYGLPEGAASSFPLFNIYLASVDARWAGNAVRYADNWATGNSTRLRKELLDLGLTTMYFVNRRSTPTQPPPQHPAARNERQ